MVQLKQKRKLVKKAIQKPKIKESTDIIKYGLNNENVARQIEENNTLVFICDLKANKPSIRKAFEKLYGSKVLKVNTLITPKGKKKAYIRMKKAGEAANVANKIGIL
ncbi:hypothetical protein EDEG_01678 [Edhazardia aedis USNM 41457]|uniref:50S ribosomal protein L23 n=1 Tax=Edhazardia aedis (strain USNM 41457) TaxID=1003232 RepID=J9D988_EDHAE|nr:hypothetical protein EDEG_01678 [Edhazardia aedis USNM 41457]|eukprot:EJW04044.1 hypothetical protein EDEG_01678 [Edhazardia aedis USNM 41457]